MSRTILKKGHTLYPPPEGGGFMALWHNFPCRWQKIVLAYQLLRKTQYVLDRFLLSKSTHSSSVILTSHSSLRTRLNSVVRTGSPFRASVIIPGPAAELYVIFPLINFSRVKSSVVFFFNKITISFLVFFDWSIQSRCPFLHFDHFLIPTATN